MNQTKTILDITRTTGNEFKRWSHKMIAAAVMNDQAKTGAQLLRNIYDELVENKELPDISKLGLLLCGNKNKLEYLANYKPNKEFALDFVMLKAEFVRLMIEKAGI